MRGTSEVGGEVVSTVDGTPITLAEVQRVVRATGWTPLRALRSLQDQRVLAREAERRGHGGDPEVRRLAERAVVQALLAERFERLEPDDSAVREAYEARKEAFDVEERRVCAHVLVGTPADAGPEVVAAARAYAENALRRMKEGESLQRVLDDARQWNEREPASPFNVKPEDLPPFADDGSLVEPFSKALFAAAEPGPLEEVVETDFGFHAVYLREILPEVHVPFSDAREIVAEELRSRKRAEALESHLKVRRIATGIEVDEAVLPIISELRL